MEYPMNLTPYNMAFDDAEIQQMLEDMQREQSMSQAIAADDPDYYDTSAYFDPTTLSPLSGYSSPSNSMTTGSSSSTNASPSAPLLDDDMSFAVGPSSVDDLKTLLFPELMEQPSCSNMDLTWMGSQPLAGGFTRPCRAAEDDGHLYPTATPLDPTVYDDDASLNPYLTTLRPTTTTMTASLLPTLSSSSPPPTITTQQNSSLTTYQNPPSTTTTTLTTTGTDLTCPHCGAAFSEKTKLRVHTNKHTKPFRCTATGCPYATAEKKSLQRHLLARSKWDEAHRAAAQDQGVRGLGGGHHCSRVGCTYATVREDNLKRHMNTCLCPPPQ
jgi:hypothetical protein